MPALKNLVGMRFGKLVVVGLAKERTPAGATQWICKCDCGNTKVVRVTNIGRNTNSCGCAHYSQGRLSHKDNFYKRWSGMMSRCYNSKNDKYHLYGALGVTVCARWKHFPNFLDDMKAKYFKGAMLDRYPNRCGNYEPENCRWATARQQVNNRRCTKFVDTPLGIMPVSEAAELAGMPRERFSSRVDAGWTEDQLFDPRNREALTKWDRRRGKRNV